MLVKHYLQKKRMKKTLVWEVLLPVIMVAYLRYVLRDTCDDAGSNCSQDERNTLEIVSAIMNPLIMCLVVPSVFSIGQRFIL